MHTKVSAKINNNAEKAYNPKSVKRFVTKNVIKTKFDKYYSEVLYLLY